MKNKLIPILATMAIMAINGFGGHSVAARADTGDIIPDAANYLRLGPDEAKPLWIQADENLGERHPIIFFNTNSAWQIKQINKIYYQVDSPDWTMPISSSINHTVDYSFNVRRARQWYIGLGPTLSGQSGIFVDWQYYDWNGNSFDTSSDTKFIQPDLFTSPARRQYEFTIPELGKTTTLTSLYSLTGEIEEDTDLNKSLIYRYKNSSSGFENYEDVESFFESRFEYYLILPLTTTTQVTIDYLALEAVDIYGNVISADSNIYEKTDGTFGFDIKKVSGTLTTNSAFFFPGSNKYKLVGITLENYADNDSEKDYDVILYAGNLIGQKEIIDTDVLTFSTVIPRNTEKQLSYLFNGDNNSILVDIPSEVTNATIKVHYADLHPEDSDTLEPFGMNLIDNNGNYGIRGALPEENEPTQSLWDKFINWLAGKLNINVGNLQTTIKWTLIGVGSLLAIAILSAFLTPIIRLIKASKKE